MAQDTRYADDGKLYASQSTITLYQKCNYKYDLIELLEIEPRFMPRPMTQGSLVHKGYEVAWKTESILAAQDAIHDAQATLLDDPEIQEYLTGEQRVKALQDADEACQIFERSFLALDPEKWEVIKLPDGTPLVEHAMRIPFTPGLFKHFYGFQGTLDFALRQRSTNTAWVFDLKVPGTLQKEGFYDMQLQMPAYLEMLFQLHGLDFSGYANYQVRARVPATPTMNKTKGGMSRSACATDWATYKRALIANGLPPSDYTDMEAKLNDFDRADYSYCSREKAERIWRNIVDTMRQMDAAHERARQYDFDTAGAIGTPRGGILPRSIHPMNCNMCYMRQYCEAALDDRDTNHLERTTYKRPGVESEALPFVIIPDDDYFGDFGA